MVLALPVAAGPAGRASGRQVARAAALESKEYLAKAAFLNHFVSYSNWPATAFESRDAPLVVAVVGEDPFGSILDETLRGRTRDGHRVEVRRYERVADLRACHLLFIARGEEGRMKELIKATAGSACLRVCDSPGLARRGAMIGFFLDDGKIRFEINPVAAGREGLTFSSKLLQYARIVEEGDS